MSVSIRSLIQDSKLERLDTRVILSYLTNFSHAQLISRDNYILSESELATYYTLYERALHGEPIAYIIGTKEFYGREFKVTSATLIPRPETELLVEKVIEVAPIGGSIIDLGTGSGCIAITIKLERPDLKVVAVDKFSDALAVAQSNADKLGVEVLFIHSDWFAAVNDSFDVIVSNPPYIEENDQHLLRLQYEPQAALTDFANGMTCINKIVADSHKFIKPTGQLLIEHGYNQGVAVRDIFEHCGYTDIITFCDYANLERFTSGMLFKI